MDKRFTNNPTLKDVSNLASVSVSTVSRVLSGSRTIRVSPETRSRILAAASTLNYKPNIMARGLKSRQTFSLALFVPGTGNPVFPEIIRGVEDGAEKLGYSVFIGHLHEQAIKNKVYLNWVQENRVDGVILATARTTDTVIDDLLRIQSPFILVNRRATNTNNYVTVDDTQGARIATDYLIDLGHRRIAHICGPLMLDTSLRRFQGYRQSLSDHNLPYENDLVVETDWLSWQGGKDAIEKIVSLGKAPTAVFAGTTMTAVGAMSSLIRAGFRIPEDISVMALHDSELAQVIEPTLTVVKMPLYQMGYRAAVNLIKILEGRPPAGPVCLEPIGLVVRGSTGPPK